MAQNSTAADDIFNQDSGENTQYFTFSLNKQEYGVDILSVVEVKVWEEVTALPETADSIKGVLNLRGTVVPIIDLRTYYGMENVEYTSETVILVLSYEIEEKQQTIGLVVDSVSDVMSIQPDQIHSSGDLDQITQTASITGVATLQDMNVIILDASKILSETQIGELVKQYPM